MFSTGAITGRHVMCTKARLEKDETMCIGKSRKGRSRKTSLSRKWFLFSAFIRERITGGVGHIDQRLD